MSMAKQIKALPTVYKGVTYRSRLEARWAIVFDELGLRPMYEPEGFEIGGRNYLPDFAFDTNAVGMAYIEIKPLVPSEFGLYVDFADSIAPIYLICGQPSQGNFSVLRFTGIGNDSIRFLEFKSASLLACNTCSTGMFFSSGMQRLDLWLRFCRCDIRLNGSNRRRAGAVMESACANRFGT